MNIYAEIRREVGAYNGVAIADGGAEREVREHLADVLLEVVAVLGRVEAVRGQVDAVLVRLPHEVAPRARLAVCGGRQRALKVVEALAQLRARVEHGHAVEVCLHGRGGGGRVGDLVGRGVADVDEADIGQVLEGQRVTFTVDAFPDDTFEGDVTQVRLNPTTESNVVTYEVVIDAPNPELKLKPGLTANITVYTMEKNDILLAPLKAFRFTPEIDPENPQTTLAPQTGKGEKVVWLQTAEGIVPKVIKVGVSDGIYTEVKEGIKEGSRLIVGVQRNKKIVPQGGNEESNPFMPPRPGQKKK